MIITSEIEYKIIMEGASGKKTLTAAGRSMLAGTTRSNYVLCNQMDGLPFFRMVLFSMKKKWTTEGVRCCEHVKLTLEAS